MKIYYQGIEGSYHHYASIKIKKELDVEVDELIGLNSFEKCWEKIEEEDAILVLAIENSTAGSIYENLYKFGK
jgi:prephenate dehydratase